MQSERCRSIIVWGPTGSGKSVYLASLVMWLTREHEQPHLAVLPADAAAAKWVARRARAGSAGIALAKREPDDHAYRFRVYETRNPDDASAGRSDVVAELTQGDGARADPSRAQLEHAAGVLMLLPVPAMSRSTEARSAHVAWLTAMLAGLPATPGAPPPAVSMPVAVCLTQTDAIPDAARRDAAQWLESFGTETTSALRAHCARFAIFKMSSLGHSPRLIEGLETVVVTPEPRGVLAPIRWILAQGEVAA